MEKSIYNWFRKSILKILAPYKCLVIYNKRKLKLQHMKNKYNTWNFTTWNINWKKNLMQNDANWLKKNYAPVIFHLQNLAAKLSWIAFQCNFEEIHSLQKKSLGFIFLKRNYDKISDIMTVYKIVYEIYTTKFFRIATLLWVAEIC